MENRRKLDRDILRFLERDENSRNTTGIKKTITVRKVKKQKRLLNAIVTGVTSEICTRDERK
jgi:hypothetical protein